MVEVILVVAEGEEEEDKTCEVLTRQWSKEEEEEEEKEEVEEMVEEVVEE